MKALRNWGGVPRLHSFEFGDQAWFPRVLRSGETAYLAAAYRMLPMLPRRWAEKIATVLPKQEPAEIVDLCSGSGGAMPRILDELAAGGFAAQAVLTDRYPNPNSGGHARIRWIEEPVNASRVPAHLKGVRTMFCAFHHFRPEAAKAILQDAFEQRRTICIFEAGSGTLLEVLPKVLVPLNVLALMPFVRPFRWSYIVFTYLIPIIPLVVFWDGLISGLRIYSPEQLQALTSDLRAPDYAWEIGRIRVRGVPSGMPYLLGRAV